MKSAEEGDVGAIYGSEKEIYAEEAEQSRLMTAISAGKSQALARILHEV